MSDKGLQMVEEFLVYGRLNEEDKQFLKEDNVFTKYYDEYIGYPYPNIEKTEEEIEELMDVWMDGEFSTKHKANNPFFMRDCDHNIKEVLYKEYAKFGINYAPIQATIENVMEKLGCLVMRLKVFYNRPRAYQVAYYTGQDFNPKATISGNSPAYPSGHSTQAWFMGLMVAELFPSKAKEVLKLANDIADTRLALGVHYPSDQEFGKFIAHDLFKKKDIRKYIFNE